MTQAERKLGKLAQRTGEQVRDGLACDERSGTSADGRTSTRAWPPSLSHEAAWLLNCLRVRGRRLRALDDCTLGQGAGGRGGQYPRTP